MIHLLQREAMTRVIGVFLTHTGPHNEEALCCYDAVAAGERRPVTFVGFMGIKTQAELERLAWAGKQ